MIALKVLFWVVIICAAIFALAMFGSITYLSLVIIPILRKERVLRRHGYEYEREYFTKGDVSIPLSWIENMSISRLDDYLARREEQEKHGQ